MEQPLEGFLGFRAAVILAPTVLKIHSPELDQIEFASAATDAFLHKEDRTTRVDLDGDADRDEKRQEHDQPGNESQRDLI